MSEPVTAGEKDPLTGAAREGLEATSVSKLVSAVAGWLAGAPSDEDPATGFYKRIAANALEAAARELRHGKAMADIERRLREAIPGIEAASPGELARAIRDGAADLDSRELKRYLRVTTRLSLARDYPRYRAVGMREVQNLTDLIASLASEDGP